MKIRKYLFLAFMAMTGALAFTACSDDDNSGNADQVVTDQKDAAFASVDSISLYDFWSKQLANAQQGNSDEDSIVAVEAKGQLAKIDSVWNAYIDANGGNSDLSEAGLSKSSVTKVKIYTVKYKSIDHNNNPITLSELVMVPYNLLRLPDRSDCTPEDIVVYCSSPLFRDYDRPTNFIQQEKNNEIPKETLAALLAAQNSIFSFGEGGGLTIVPDFQGFGESRDMVYPCGSYELLARQAVDGLEAVVNLVEEGKLPSMKDPNNWKTSFIGYSEGGSIALAAHKYLETNNVDGTTLADKYNLGGSVVVDPYYFFDWVSDYGIFYSYNPFYLARIINAVCETSPFLKGKYTAKDYFTEEFVNTGILDFLNNKDESLASFMTKYFDCSWNTTQSEGLIQIPFKEKFLGYEISWQYYNSDQWAKLSAVWAEAADYYYGYYNDEEFNNEMFVEEAQGIISDDDIMNNHVVDEEPRSMRLYPPYILNSQFFNQQSFKEGGLYYSLKATLQSLNILTNSWSPTHRLYYCYTKMTIGPHEYMYDTFGFGARFPDDSAVRYRYTNKIITKNIMLQYAANLLWKLRHGSTDNTKEEEF